MTELDVLELNVANAFLGVATAICVLMVAWGVLAELAQRFRARLAHRAADDHLFAFPEVGLTMADGGEKVDRDEDSSPFC